MEMLSDNRKVAVVYLSWLPYGIEHLQEFVRSYLMNPAGYPHKLVFLFNGLDHSQDVSHFRDCVSSALSDFEILELNDGMDIDAYFFAAKEIDADYILFLNTYSRFQSGEWLRKYMIAMSEDTGVISATASCQSLYSTVFHDNKWSWESHKSFSENFRKFKLLLKATCYWRFLIAPFPNPHVRTNAFLVRRNDFLQLKRKTLNRKFDAYLFESGKQSLTRQLAAKGLKALVVGRDGTTYDMSRFEESRTFWTGEQENLLVSDNQTEMYKNADSSYRSHLNEIAWHL